MLSPTLCIVTNSCVLEVGLFYTELFLVVEVLLATAEHVAHLGEELV